MLDNVIDRNNEILFDKENSFIKKGNNNHLDSEICISPYKKDEDNIEKVLKKSFSSPTIISFEMENKDKEINSIINKLTHNKMTNEEIQKFIADINDNTIKAILDAIDKMIENARKMMEQNKIYYEKVERPKLELIKKILQQELIAKEMRLKS
jgi:hypothetical protein